MTIVKVKDQIGAKLLDISNNDLVDELLIEA